MGRFLAGAAITALLTVFVGGITAGTVYVPVGASNSGLTEAQQAATPTADYVLTYPLSADQPTSGPLAIDLGIAMVGNNARGTATLTNSGVPVAAQRLDIYAQDPLDYPPSSCSRPTAQITLDRGCTYTFGLSTNSAGQLTYDLALSGYHRGTVIRFYAAATYQGRTVSVTKRALIQ